MSGVAIVNQLLFIFNLSIFGGLAGAGIFTAQYFGKEDNEGIRYTMRMKFKIAMGIFIIAMALLIFFGQNLISLFIHEGGEALDLTATMTYAKDYLHVMLIGLFPFALSQVFSSTLRETGETILPMKAGIVAVFVNLVFNYILIYGKLGAPALGVVGAAIATVLSRFVELAIIMIWAYKHTDKVPYVVGAFKSMKVPKDLSLNTLKTGLPLLLNELLWSAGMASLTQCYSVRGLDVVSACNIAGTVTNLFNCAFLAMGTTVSIMIGQILGSGDLERAVDEDRKLIAFAVAMCVVIGAVLAIFCPVLPNLYNTTPNVKHLASQIMLVGAIMMPISACCNCSYFTIRAGGNVLITILFDSAYLWVLCFPLAFILSRFTAIPILPMYIAVQALDLIKCAFGLYLVSKRKWVKNLVG